MVNRSTFNTCQPLSTLAMIQSSLLQLSNWSFRLFTPQGPVDGPGNLDWERRGVDEQPQGMIHKLLRLSETCQHCAISPRTSLKASRVVLPPAHDI